MASKLSYKPVFYVDALTPAKAEDAFPLVRAIAPEVTLESWCNYVQRRRSAGGLLELRDQHGATVGVLSYRQGERMRNGLVLALDDFVTFELSQGAPGRAALLKAAEKLGGEMGCTGIELRVGARGLADPSAAKVQGWISLGFELESVVLVKPI